MGFDHRCSNRLGEGLRIQPTQGRSLHLLHHHEPLLSALLHRERPPEPRAQGLVGAGHRGLNVLRIVIASSDDDEVFAATGHKQLAVLKKAQVPCAEIGVGIVWQAGPEGCGGEVVLVAIPHRHAWSAHPNLPDLARFEQLLPLRIHHDEALIAHHRAAGHQRPTRPTICLKPCPRALQGHHPVIVEGAGGKLPNQGGLTLLASRHDQRVFG